MEQYVNRSRLKFRVLYDGRYYEMPDCRLKIDASGGISALIIDENNKWKNVKAVVEILESKNDNIQNFLSMFNKSLLDSMSNLTNNIHVIHEAIKKTFNMDQEEQEELFKSLSTNMPHQNSVEENLQLLVLEYLQ